MTVWQPLLSTPVVGQDTVLPVWPPAQQSRAACVYLDIGLKPAEKHRWDHKENFSFFL